METKNWFSRIYSTHFEISDIEKTFGEYKNSQHIILSVKDVIHLKGKTGGKWLWET